MKQIRVTVSFPKLFSLLFVGGAIITWGLVTGVHSAHSSAATTVNTLYKMAYPGGTKYEIYNTIDAASSKTEQQNGWKLLGTYKYVNEAGSAPIPVYRAHQANTKNNAYSTNKASLPAGWGVSTAFYESSSATVPYGYCRSTASGYKLDYACSSNPAPVKPPPSPPPGGGSGGGTTGNTGDTGNNNSGSGVDTTVDTGTDDSVDSAGTTASAAADAVATVGTTSVQLVVPNGDAASMHITYGISGGPTVGTDDEAVDGDATIDLEGLQAKTAYTFVIVRTGSDGTAVSSPAATFTTAGYSVTLHFKNNAKKNIAGVQAAIDSDTHSSGKSDKSGTITFTDVAGGKHKVSYTINNHTYVSSVDTSSDESSADDKGVISLSDTVNVDALLPGSHAKKASSSHGIVWVIIGLFVVAGVAFWVIFQRIRRNRLLAEYSTLATPLSAPSPQSPSVPAYTPVQAPAVPETQHVGESLRDMVIQSMQANAQQPGSVPATHPLTPGGQPIDQNPQTSVQQPPYPPTQPPQPQA